MTALFVVAFADLRRFVRSRSVLVFAVLAPLAIMGAFAATIGSAFGSIGVPDLVVVEQDGDPLLGPLVDGLRDEGFEVLTVVDDPDLARTLVEDGTHDAALLRAPDAASDEIELLVLGNTDSSAELSVGVAEVLARRAAAAIATAQALDALDAPAGTTLPASSFVVVEEQAPARVLLDETYFAVGTAGFFLCMAAVSVAATMHEDRANGTLGRLLMAPVGRELPVLAKAVACGVVVALAFTTLHLGSVVFLGADWGPIAGVALLGGALVITAVGQAMAITTVAVSQHAAGAIGTALNTAWAVFGGVFLVIPRTGFLNTLSRFSPFRWLLDGVGVNAGVGFGAEVVVHAGGVASFGLVAAAVAASRRREVRAG